MLFTDLELDSIQIATLKPSEFPTDEEVEEEKSAMLLKKHASLDNRMGESSFDVNRLFELNLAHDLAAEQRKSLNFLDEGDLIDDLLFKHHQMLIRCEHNFGRLNDQLVNEIASEEQMQSKLISAAQVVSTHEQLLALYGLAEDLKVSLLDVLQQSR